MHWTRISLSTESEHDGCRSIESFQMWYGTDRCLWASRGSIFNLFQVWNATQKQTKKEENIELIFSATKNAASKHRLIEWNRIELFL